MTPNHSWHYQPVEFESEGATLRGRLYTPTDAEGPFPIVVMAHGFSATITMTIDHYAEAICDSGFAALLYDHRNFGLSGGEPRQQINPWIQARGYRDALTFAGGRDIVDSNRLAIWGDSASSAGALVVAAADDRVKVVVIQCPAFGPTIPEADPTGTRFAQIQETLLAGNVQATPDGIDDPMPVVSFDPIRHKSALEPLTAFNWFMSVGGRIGTNWLNDVTRARPNVPEPWNAVLCAPNVHQPTLVIVSPDDEIRGSNPVVARAAYDAIPGTKKWVEIDGGHFGLLWYPGELFDQASQTQREFLIKYL
jgi:uncharacterized protein